MTAPTTEGLDDGPCVAVVTVPITAAFWAGAKVPCGYPPEAPIHNKKRKSFDHAYVPPPRASGGSP